MDKDMLVRRQSFCDVKLDSFDKIWRIEKFIKQLL